ncbi:mucin-15 [Trematomus bernacchii]|uniref:mucin-15 n=1 Tax=Trematomus bernacchii TaxID=40690 RepID=UPI00146A3552|nr:mucin-15 [Trematomus bernacchii]
MGLYLKTTACLFLFVQAFHLASLQNSTDSPGRTIDKSWLRELANKVDKLQDAADKGAQNESSEANIMDPSNEHSSGKASGSMVIFTEEEKNLEQKETSDDLTVVTNTAPTKFPTRTKQPELPGTTVSPTPAATDSSNSSKINMTEAEEELQNSTTTPRNSSTELSTQNSTSVSDHSNTTDSQKTTLAPKSNTTQESKTKPHQDTGITKSTEHNSNTTLPTTVKQEINKTTLSPSTTVLPSETTETSPATTAAAAPKTPVTSNKTDKAGASGNNPDRGLATDTHTSKRNGAWGAVLGTGVAVAFVGLVAYVILKKKQQKGFTHRKLVEEFPSDPVLRLDNSEPLDLNFGVGRSAYYNPGLQGDNIQMSNFP